MTGGEPGPRERDRARKNKPKKKSNGGLIGWILGKDKSNKDLPPNSGYKPDD